MKKQTKKTWFYQDLSSGSLLQNASIQGNSSTFFSNVISVVSLLCSVLMEDWRRRVSCISQFRSLLGVVVDLLSRRKTFRHWGLRWEGDHVSFCYCYVKTPTWQLPFSSYRNASKKCPTLWQTKTLYSDRKSHYICLDFCTEKNLDPGHEMNWI